ncbi:chromosome condensation [Pyrenophora seminiperda CCB06]|uniref:Chromosome condensation n=1 Tax=Pyrenophora seminiperda CCB06 TaxID=1302712 RepID=A0A3M7MA58_9PLEO|nr:chromosome condensation [Pyrenophora seminiperda CCB06]
MALGEHGRSTQQRDFHFNSQRSEHRQSFVEQDTTPAGPPTRSRPHSELPTLSHFDLDDKTEIDRAESLNSDSSPAPNVPYTRPPPARADTAKRRDKNSLGRRISRSTTDSRIAGVREGQEPLYNDTPRPQRQPGRTRGLSGLSDVDFETSREASHPRRPREHSRLSDGIFPASSTSQIDITALPSMKPVKEDDYKEHYVRSHPSPQAQKASRLATNLYTVSYLVFFSIWGTLARLGLQALTFYPGAPVIFSGLWANVAGTFILAFLQHDDRLFAAEWGNTVEPSLSDDNPNPNQAKARHDKIKKTIPMYIGLATGFCGSLTSFSSFMRDMFLAISNDLSSPPSQTYLPNNNNNNNNNNNQPAPSSSSSFSPTSPRNGGYSFLALAATIILTLAACFAALTLGSHLAEALRPCIPTLPFRPTRRVLDPLSVALAATTWLAAIILAAVPPRNHTAWRGQALFAAALAPPGALLRYYISAHMNRLTPHFPLGTFAVNIFGTAVLAMAWDLQHLELGSDGVVGGSVVACQVLQGVMDGFCGALTTVSTWIAEMASLKRGRAYVYGSASLVAGLALVLVLLGSVRWTVGWKEGVCAI